MKYCAKRQSTTQPFGAFKQPTMTHTYQSAQAASVFLRLLSACENVFCYHSPKSESIYFEAEILDHMGDTKKVNVRVSDHAHPSKFEGLDLYDRDISELEPLLDSFFERGPKTTTKNRR